MTLIASSSRLKFVFIKDKKALFLRKASFNMSKNNKKLQKPSIVNNLFIKLQQILSMHIIYYSSEIVISIFIFIFSFP